jgi:hypothetical protein
MCLVVGNGMYSSWSLRAWLALERLDIAFEGGRIALFEPGYKGRIQRNVPAGKVPVLVDGDNAVPLDADRKRYVEQLWNLPAMLEWRSAAARETEVIAEDEPYR